MVIWKLNRRTEVEFRLAKNSDSPPTLRPIRASSPSDELDEDRDTGLLNRLLAFLRELHPRRIAQVAFTFLSGPGPLPILDAHLHVAGVHSGLVRTEAASLEGEVPAGFGIVIGATRIRE